MFKKGIGGTAVDTVFLVCSKLGIDPGIAVMCFECTSRLQDGTAVEYSKSYARGDMCNYSIRFQQSPRS